MTAIKSIRTIMWARDALRPHTLLTLDLLLLRGDHSVEKRVSAPHVPAQNTYAEDIFRYRSRQTAPEPGKRGIVMLVRATDGNITARKNEDLLAGGGGLPTE
jgi:hypothetical protein